MKAPPSNAFKGPPRPHTFERQSPPPPHMVPLSLLLCSRVDANTHKQPSLCCGVPASSSCCEATSSITAAVSCACCASGRAVLMAIRVTWWGKEEYR